MAAWWIDQEMARDEQQFLHLKPKVHEVNCIFEMNSRFVVRRQDENEFALVQIRLRSDNDVDHLFGSIANSGETATASYSASMRGRRLSFADGRSANDGNEERFRAPFDRCNRRLAHNRKE